MFQLTPCQCHGDALVLDVCQVTRTPAGQERGVTPPFPSPAAGRGSRACGSRRRPSPARVAAYTRARPGRRELRRRDRHGQGPGPAASRPVTRMLPAQCADSQPQLSLYSTPPSLDHHPHEAVGSAWPAFAAPRRRGPTTYHREPFATRRGPLRPPRAAGNPAAPHGARLVLFPRSARGALPVNTLV